MLDTYEQLQTDDYNIDYNNEEEDEENENYINEYNESKFIYESDIKKERENKIKKAMNIFYLKREDAILVMIYLQWNLDKSEIWYDNLEQNKIKVGIELSEETKEDFKKKN